jgi:predicted acyl esterase
VPTDLRIPLGDGIELAADLTLPRGEGPWPAILVQTPYGKERIGAAMPHVSARSWLDFLDRDAEALVVADWRGYGSSPPRGTKPPHRGEDGRDAVEWVAAQPWCNGRVAAWGPSALGRAVLRTAAAAPLPLVCGVPVVCHMGHLFEDFYDGGVLEEAHARAVDMLGFTMADRIRGASDPADPFWRAGAAESRPGDLDLPLLFVTGWYDLVTAQTLRFFEEVRRLGGPRAKAYSRLLIGPWHHTGIDQGRQGQVRYPAAAGEAARETRKFLDCWLRRRRAPDGELPALVRYYQMGEDRWLETPHWPPPGIAWRTLRLGAEGLLTPGPGDEGGRRFVSDPADPVPTVGGANLPLGVKVGPFDQRKLEARPDVLVYSTEPRPEPVRVVGAPAVTVDAVSDRPGAHLAARLCDVWPDGRSLLVADSIVRAPAGPAGAPFTARIALPPVAQTFGVGHRIRLILAGSNHPRYALHEGVAVVTVLHGGAAGTALHLPVLGS